MSAGVISSVAPFDIYFHNYKILVGELFRSLAEHYRQVRLQRILSFYLLLNHHFTVVFFSFFKALKIVLYFQRFQLRCLTHYRLA